MSIIITKAADRNSAATKATDDCRRIFSELGYEDYSLKLPEGMGVIKYYSSIFFKLTRFFLKLKYKSVVGIQYPMLNNVFKIFIKTAAAKKIRFFCIIHDIESLRLGGTDGALVKKEAANLNYYDYLIVHNENMLQWLKTMGVTCPMYVLGLFDYLSSAPLRADRSFSKTIVFAGNLAKSEFIYKLNEVSAWRFNIYGPNFKHVKKVENLQWVGSFSPNEIADKLDGDFGLIWDGESTGAVDAVWGNYLKYNNPHKFSLYLASGLPVIAPRIAAIAKLIEKENIGVLIDNLHDISDINMSMQQYSVIKKNCIRVRAQIINGENFRQAVMNVESKLIKSAFHSG